MEEVPQLVRQNAMEGDKLRAFFISARTFYVVDGVIEALINKDAGLEILAMRCNDPVIVNLVKLVEKEWEKEEEGKIGLKLRELVANGQAIFEMMANDAVGESVSWDRVVAVLALDVSMARVLKLSSKAELAKNWVAEFFDNKFAPWIFSQAGQYDNVIPYATTRLS